MKRERLSGFTLIELLIVVLIIAILAAIAVPNFLEFQTRSKVSRAKSDMRSLATAIEAYMVDAGQYPPDGNDIAPFNPANFSVAGRLAAVTTPIAYITQLPRDIFNTPYTAFPGSAELFPEPGERTYVYNTLGNYLGLAQLGPGPRNGGKPNNYTLTSLGPSGFFDSIIGDKIEYDPTNGTVSTGDINYSGGVRVVVPDLPGPDIPSSGG